MVHGAMTPLEQHGHDVVLRVRVQPKASREAVVVEPDGRFRVALTAPPVDGAANSALVAFLAKRLGVSKSRVALTHGATSREKTLRIVDVTVDEVTTRLGATSG